MEDSKCRKYRLLFGTGKAPRPWKDLVITLLEKPEYFCDPNRKTKEKKMWLIGHGGSHL
jgi:hypothetical protein